MPTTFPTPRTEDEAIDHLHTQHGMPPRNLAEWREMFPSGRLASSIHGDLHDAVAHLRRGHQHRLLWAAP